MRFIGFLLVIFVSFGCTELMVADGGVDAGRDSSTDTGMTDSGDLDSGSTDGDTGLPPVDTGVDGADADTSVPDTSVDTAPPPDPPEVTAVIARDDAEAGTPIDLECRVIWTGDAGDLDYAWEVDGTPISGTLSTNSWTPPIQEGDATVRCVVTDSLGRMSAGTAIVSVLVGRSILVARYPFNNDVLDASGNGHDGTLSGALYRDTRAAAIGGRALEFDGGDSVTISHAADLSLSQYTITAFVQPLAPDTSDRTIISKAAPTSFGNWTLYLFPSNHATASIRNDLSVVHDTAAGNWSGLGSSVAFTTGAWRHVAVTIRSDGTGQTYSDGARDRSLAAVTAPRLGTNDVTIGNGARGGFVGRIDEVRIYGAPLGDTEVAAIAASPY